MLHNTEDISNEIIQYKIVSKKIKNDLVPSSPFIDIVTRHAKVNSF